MTRSSDPIGRSLALCLCALVTAWSAPAQGGPFDAPGAFVGPQVKTSSKGQRFQAGASFSIAPVRAIIRSQVNKQVDSYVQDNPDAAAMKEFLVYADTDQMRALANSGQLDAFKAALKDEMAAQGAQLSPAQQSVIDGITPAQLKTVADMIDIMNDPDDTLTFSLEPWVAINFDHFSVKAMVPIAGFTNDRLDLPSLQLGNLSLEATTGAKHQLGKATLGWSLGAQAFLPTATEDANALALANITNAPRFLHQYFSVAPYASLGLQVAFMEFSLYGQYVHMLKARGEDVGVVDQSYVQAGGSVVGSVGRFRLSMELDGLIDVQQAASFGGTLLMTLGGRVMLGPVNLGVGVQMPLVRSGTDDAYYDVGGVATGTPADFNFLVDARLRI